MKIVPFDDVDPARWNACCDESREAWLFHRAEWVAIETAHLAPRSAAFAVEDSGSIVAVVPAYVATLGLGTWSEKVVHSGIHRHAGIAVRDGLDLGMLRAVRGAALRGLCSVALDVDADRIHLGVQNLAPVRRERGLGDVPFWVLEGGFFLGLGVGPSGLVPAPGIAACCADQIIDLSVDEPVLFQCLAESCRRAVRKAHASGLSLEVPGNDPVDRYFALAVASATRTGESLAPPAYFRDVWGRLGSAGLASFLFAVEGGSAIGALMLLRYKGAAHFLGGVSDPARLSTRVNDFIHWEAMRWAKRQGLGLYRLGPTFPELPADWPVSRVSRFKGKFGGIPTQVIQGSRFLRPQRYLDAAVDHLRVLAEPGEPS